MPKLRVLTERPANRALEELRPHRRASHQHDGQEPATLNDPLMGESRQQQQQQGGK